MPYDIVPYKNGFRLQLLSEPNKLFTKHPQTYETVKRQMRAIERSKHLRAGSIGNIPIDNLFKIKTLEEIPERMKQILKIGKFPKNRYIKSNDLLIMGSYYAKLFPYFSDLDTLSKIEFNLSKDDTAIIVSKIIQEIILKNIQKADNTYFTDLKAGINKSGEALHWTIDEVAKGQKDGTSLVDAVKTPEALLKLDLIAPYYSRYIEASFIYNINTKDGYLNVNGDKLTGDYFYKQITDDIQKQIAEGNYFKAVKRIFSASRIKNDRKNVKLIEPLLVSNVAKLSTIASDFKTILLLLEKKINFDRGFVINQMEMYKDRFSNILDININEPFLDSQIDKITNLLRTGTARQLEKQINAVVDYLQKVVNTETVSYLKEIGYSFPKT
jgi:hypothetical protein